MLRVVWVVIADLEDFIAFYNDLLFIIESLFDNLVAKSFFTLRLEAIAMDKISPLERQRHLIFRVV